MNTNYPGLIIGLCAALLPLAAPAQKPDAAETQLEAAMRKERLDGDLKNAIALYARLAKSANRAVAAKALVRMGQCHERLGDAQARKLYEQAIREFADQKETVIQARARLSALGENAHAGEVRARLVWDDRNAFGRVSADGRLFSFVDWSTGDLALRDLQTGESRRVTNKGGYEKAQGEAEETSITPDGKRIAFSWQRWDRDYPKGVGAYQVRVINSDGSGERVLMLGEFGGYVEPRGWTPDGQWVLISIGEENANRLLLANPESGEVRKLDTGVKGFARNATFSPDGKWIAIDESFRGEGGGLYLMSVAAGPAIRFEENSRLLGWSPDGRAVLTLKEYGGTRRIFRVPVENGRATREPELVQVPGIGEASPAGITASGALYYETAMRQTEAWVIPSGGDWMQPVGKIPVALAGISNNVGNLRFSPEGARLAMMTAGPAITIRTNSDGAQRTITPELRDIRRLEWTPDGQAFLAAGTHRNGRSGLYRIEISTSETRFVCDLEPGVYFAVAPDGQSVFHLTEKGLTRIELATGKHNVLSTRDLRFQGPLNLRVSRDGKQIALTSFRYLGVYDIASGKLRDLDVREDKRGPSIWSVDWSADGASLHCLVRPGLGEGYQLHVYPAAGGAPHKTPLPVNLRNYTISADGKYVAATRWENRSQLWVLENLLPAGR